MLEYIANGEKLKISVWVNCFNSCGYNCNSKQYSGRTTSVYVLSAAKQTLIAKVGQK